MEEGRNVGEKGWKKGGGRKESGEDEGESVKQSYEKKKRSM